MNYSRYNKGPRQRKFRNQQELLKYLLKTGHKQSPFYPIESLVDASRVRYDDDGYGATEYGFIYGSEKWTDEDISEWKKESWLRIYGPYDCTGKWFTCWIDCHRNPNGVVSFVHKLGVDL